MHHQQFLEVLAFHLFEALPAHFCKREFGVEQNLGGVSILSQDFLGKIFRTENPCLFQDVGPFDDIFQFTHITGPIVLLERLDDKRVNPLNVLKIMLVEPFDQGINDLRYVFGAFPKRRQLDRKNTETVIKVPAETSFLTESTEV